MPTFAEQCRLIRETPKLAALSWQAGQLWWKLHEAQFQMYEQFYATQLDEEVWNCARRLGKTFLEVILSFECVLQNPSARVKFAAQTQKDVRKIIKPMIATILKDCPASLKPKINWVEGTIEFPGRGGIDIAGCDNGNYVHLRGQECHLWIVDEAAFIDDLELIVDSVLSPQTWTTGGRGIIASTPPETPGHHFQHRYLAAKLNGASARFTFADNPLISEQRKAEIIAKQAKRKRLSVEEFKKTTHYLREFCAEFVAEKSRAGFPEYGEMLEAETLKDSTSWTRPWFVDRYTIVDTGNTRDPDAILCAYWDFDRQKLVCVKNRVIPQPSTRQLANAVKEAEREAWGEKFAPGTETFRYVDGNEKLVTDLALEHGLTFHQTKKDDKDAAIKNARDWLIDGKVDILTDCRETSAHLRAAMWNKHHTEWERVEGFGHFDLADDFVYLVRNVVPNVNRLPRYYGVDRSETFVAEKPDPSAEGLRLLAGGDA